MWVENKFFAKTKENLRTKDLDGIPWNGGPEASVLLASP